MRPMERAYHSKQNKGGINHEKNCIEHAGCNIYGHRHCMGRGCGEHHTATAKELQKVHGIGAKIADMIVTYRDEHGAFKSVEELKHVKGIGKKTLEKIKDDLTTGEAKE